MKKLLSMLGTITLIGTASTSVIACGKGDEPSPNPDTRTDISAITQLTGLDITADIQKTYNDLWTEIFKANEFKNLTYNSYETFMYKTNDLKDTTDIKELKQQKGDIYIILQVGKNEGINCFGDTPRLKITLK